MHSTSFAKTHSPTMNRRNFLHRTWGLLAVPLLPAPAMAVQQMRVASINLVGLRNVAEATVKAALTLREGQAYSEEAVERCRKSLSALGYFRRVTVLNAPTPTGVLVTFQLLEWPRVLHIRVTGNTVVSMPDVFAEIKSRRGEVLQTQQLQRDVSAIEQLYRERGYVGRVSSSLVDDAAATGILRFQILEVRIAAIEVECPDAGLRTRCRAVLKEISPNLYRPEAVAGDQGRLLEIRGVRSASPRVEPIEPGKVRVRWFINALPTE